MDGRWIGDVTDQHAAHTLPTGFLHPDTTGDFGDGGLDSKGGAILEKVAWARRAASRRPLSRLQPKCLRHRRMAFQGPAFPR